MDQNLRCNQSLDSCHGYSASVVPNQTVAGGLEDYHNDIPSPISDKTQTKHQSRPNSHAIDSSLCLSGPFVNVTSTHIESSDSQENPPRCKSPSRKQGETSIRYTGSTPSPSWKPRSSLFGQWFPDLWRPTIYMVLFVLLGAGVAIAHHYAYATLNQKPVSRFPQLWANNLGIVAAFIVKTSFTIAIGLAFQEMLWRNLRGRHTKIGSLDKLFTVQSNPLNFFSIDAFKTAPYALILAAIAWIIPIVAVLTPGTLGVDILTTQSARSCQIPTFPGNMDLQNHSAYSHNFFQADPVTSHLYSYQPMSEELKELAMQTLIRGQILPIASPCTSNCSFQTEFPAPALKCVDEKLPLLDPNMPLYQCTADRWNSTNITVTYINAYQSNITSALEDGGSPDDFSKGWRTISCRAFEASYRLNVTFTNSEALYETAVTYRNELQPLNSTEESVPEGFYQHTNYAMLTQATFGYLIGRVEQIDSLRATTTQIQDTQLAASITYYNDDNRAFEVLKDLRTGIPELLLNLTLSTISWNEVQTNSTCINSSAFPAYSYQSFWIIFPYMCATVLALSCVYVGSFAVYRSGIRTGDIFSQILVTTRNPLLDRMTEGESLTSHGSKWLKSQRIVLGELRDASRETGEVEVVGAKHAAFGVKGQTLKLRKWQAYT